MDSGCSTATRPWEALPATAVARLGPAFGSPGTFRIICQPWVAVHDISVQELAPREWPEVEQLRRLLARMPCLAKLDLSRLGPHPSGSNCMAELLALQGLKQGLVELRLEAASLPVQEMRFAKRPAGGSRCSMYARVALPAELVELKALRALHLLRSTKNAPNNTDIALSAGSAVFDMPSLRHLVLHDLQRPCLDGTGGYEGGLAAFSPCLPRLELLALHGHRNQTRELHTLLLSCKMLQGLELNGVLGGEYSDMDSAEQAVLLFKGLASMQHFTKLELETIASDHELHHRAEEIIEHMVALTRLRHLDLYNCAFNMPSCYTQLQQLTYLHCPMEFVPGEELGALKGLQVLVAGQSLDVGPPVSQLPDSFGQLGQLHQFTIRDHQLEGLPMALAGCSQLTRLSVRGAGLQGWPDVLRRLTSLVHLDLSGSERMCQVMEPGAFEGLRRLQRLDLSLTGLQHLPSSFTTLTALRAVNLSYNSLQQLPEGLVLPQLETINLDCTAFSEVPPQLQRSPLLAEISMKRQGADAIELDDEFHRELLQLPYSHARDLPAWLLELPALRKLEVDEQPLVRSRVLGQLRARWQALRDALEPRGL